MFEKHFLEKDNCSLGVILKYQIIVEMYVSRCIRTQFNPYSLCAFANPKI